MLFLILIGLYSCTAILYDIEMPAVKKKLVVNGTFEEGKNFNIIISQNITRATTQKMEPVKDAIVFLYKNEQLIDTLSVYENVAYLDPVFKWHYKSKVEPVSGNKYSIKASAEGFNDVSAESTVPFKAVINLKSWEKVKKTEQHESEYLRFNLEISNVDPDGYYFLAVAKRRSFSDNSKSYSLFIMNDPILGRFENSVNADYLLFKGAAIPSKHYLFSINLGENFFSSLKNNNIVFFELLSLSEEEYKYRETLTAQKNVDNRISEPIKVYSNIEGGLGIFAGISVMSDSLVWKN